MHTFMVLLKPKYSHLIPIFNLLSFKIHKKASDIPLKRASKLCFKMFNIRSSYAAASVVPGFKFIYSLIWTKIIIIKLIYMPFGGCPSELLNFIKYICTSPYMPNIHSNFGIVGLIKVNDKYLWCDRFFSLSYFIIIFSSTAANSNFQFHRNFHRKIFGRFAHRIVCILSIASAAHPFPLFFTSHFSAFVHRSIFRSIYIYLQCILSHSVFTYFEIKV